MNRSKRSCKRTGERPNDARRGLELTILQRGMESVAAELDEAEQREADGQKEALG